MATNRILHFPPNKAPCWFNNEEASAWSSGADHGAREALAAINLLLKNEAGGEWILAFIKEHIKLD